jgi:hypothetical protein
MTQSLTAGDVQPLMTSWDLLLVSLETKSLLIHLETIQRFGCMCLRIVRWFEM